MTASDWWLVVLVCVCVAGAGLGFGFLRGMWVGLDVAEDSMIEAYERMQAMDNELDEWRADDPEHAALRDELKALRADLTRQLNRQLDLE